MESNSNSFDYEETAAAINKKASMLDFVDFLSDSESDIEVEDERENETIIDDVKHPTVVQTKKSSEKKKETLALIHQFHTHIVSLEKERKLLWHSKSRQDDHLYNDLEEIENKNNKNRSKEKKEIQENLVKISSKIEKFKRDKSEVRKCASNLEKLKILMEEIEENIMQFKEKQRIIYEDLLTDEKALSAEIEASGKKLHSWEQPTTKSKTSKSESEKGKRQAQLPKEVEEFENFIVLTGGHQGGWDDIDHQMFLKLRKQYKKNEQLLSAAIREIPTQNNEDIEQHIEWYDEYCILRERKRETIRLWKNLKENEREDMLKNVDLDNNEEEKKRKKKEELIEKERNERFQRLKGYKAKRQLVEQEEQRMKVQLDKQSKEIMKMNNMIEERKRLELKLQVEDYRLKKKEEEDILRQAEEEKILKEKQNISEEEKNRIKERNEKHVESKRQHQLSKKYEDEEKEKRLQRLRQTVTVNVERDPNRLFKLTAGWERRKEDTTKTSSHVTGARMMPHRSVPSWRQGMS